MTVADPTDEYEQHLCAAGAQSVIGCDEVGRGAVAGPVAVGVAAWIPGVGVPPAGLRDSKMLSEKRRTLLDPLVRQWMPFHAVGMAAATEVDEVGIIAALGIAGKRALNALARTGFSFDNSVLVLDGAHNWLAPALKRPLDIRTRVKADRDCVSVAAASVIAKVHRDTLMIASDATTPGYGWTGNKGYGSGAHMAAIERLGLTDMHRRSWLVPSA